MQDLDQRLTAQSNKILERFCSALGSVSPIGAAVTVGAAIAPFIVYAVAQEASYSRDLLSAKGPQALRDFQALTPNTAMAFVTQALTGSLPLPAQNIKGVAMLAEATLPLIAAAGVYLAKSFTNLKQQITDLQIQNSVLGSGKPLPAFTADTSDRPRGATRLQLTDSAPQPQPASQRFDAAIAAMGEKLSADQHVEAKTRIKGPGL